MRSACALKLRNVLRSCSRKGRLSEALAALNPTELEALQADWQVWAHDSQLPPTKAVDGGDWRVWLVLGGRGAGKTRAGAEWVKAMALGEAPFANAPVERIALVGETMADVRSVMVEGVSGLLAIHRAEDRPVFEPSKNRLTWRNGAVAQMFSAEGAEGLRGPQFGAAWCDEIAKWANATHAWDMLQFALRLGQCPQVVVTTTPKPVPVLKSLIGDERTVVSRASTTDNAENLAPTFIDEMRRRYAGTALGRQELNGELIEDVSGSLWRRDWIDDARVKVVPDLTAIVVAVDPPVTATVRSDACGIVVAGLDGNGAAMVLADRSVQGREPATWARAVIAAYHDFEADRVVAEVNQGGDLVRTVLQQIDARVPVRSVRATRGKWLRAEPVAALYAEGRIRHAGVFEELEDEMCVFGSDGKANGHSPDRLDALVWAVTDLMLSNTVKPKVRRL
ncbi:MAG: terminase family protein [Pseudomonadota bacterium]